MGSFYGSNILMGKINRNTGNAWKLEDVPSYWRVATEKWLAANT